MIQNVVSLVSAITVWAVANAAPANELVLAENGQSAYKIVLADSASPSTKHGAEELQVFLEQMTGVKLPIISDQQPQGPKEIMLGDNTHLRKLGMAIDFATLGQEGYVIRTRGEHLIIAGGQLRGNMYGVYGLLEDHLGCRWFAPGVSRIPKHARLAIGAIDDRHIPVLEYREPGVYDCLDGDWCARNRMNSGSGGRLDEKHGGRFTWGDGFFCHSFCNRLVTPAKYFDKHPEYFALVKGKRQKETPQLCCTNPDVIRICTEELLQVMRAQPKATVFSVSINDYGNYCECLECQTLAKQEDSQMGPVLQLVNHVAEAVEKEFPDKAIETLAYMFAQRPPKHIRPRPNVIIRLAPIGCCISHPMATCDCKENRAARADLEAWANVTSRIWIWDYVTDFGHYLAPFPNHRMLAPNIRYYVAHNVKGIFLEDAYHTPDSELWALGGYMMAKLLWNPNYDPNLARDEFLAGYYGKAAVPIRQYLDLLNGRVEQNPTFHFYGRDSLEPSSPYLSYAFLVKANELWQRAEDFAADDPELLERVKLSRMSVDYAIVERARPLGLALPANAHLVAAPLKGWRPPRAPLMPIDSQFLSFAATRFNPYFETLDRSKLTHLSEGGGRLDKKAYRQEMAKELHLQP